MITASGGDIQDDGGVILTSLLASADPGLRLPLSHLVFISLTWASEDAAPASVVLACLR